MQLDIAALNDATAQEIADKARYGATPSYVERVYREWRVWKNDRQERSATAASEGTFRAQMEPKEKNQKADLRSWIRSNHQQAAHAVSAYRDEIRLQMALEEVKQTGAGATWPPDHEYGDAEKGIIESILGLDSELSESRGQFHKALTSGDLEEARRLSRKIFSILESWLILKVLGPKFSPN